MCMDIEPAPEVTGGLVSQEGFDLEKIEMVH